MDTHGLRAVDPLSKLEAVENYSRWLRRAGPSEKFIYYVGLSPAESYIGSIVAGQVYRDYEKGLVHPFMKRRAENSFHFMVMRTKQEI